MLLGKRHTGMSGNEIRQRKTSDPEMDAINIIYKALTGLTRVQAERVVKWAETRFVREDPLTDSQSLGAANKFFAATTEMVRRLNTDGPTLLAAMARVADDLGPQNGSETDESVTRA
jgi:hypothetical protein